MRRVRPDVSHRIRRQPSIFSVRWFRIALGAGVVLVIALLVGPSVAAWFGGDCPESLFLLVPGGGRRRPRQARPPDPKVSRPSLSSPGALPPDVAKGPGPSTDAAKGPATATVKPPSAPADIRRLQVRASP